MALPEIKNWVPTEGDSRVVKLIKFDSDGNLIPKDIWQSLGFEMIEGPKKSVWERARLPEGWKRETVGCWDAFLDTDGNVIASQYDDGITLPFCGFSLPISPSSNIVNIADFR